MPRKSRSGKNLVLLRCFLPNRFWLIGDRGIQKMKTPAPFYEGHLSLFIICEHIWHFVQYNMSYHRPIYSLYKYEEKNVKWFTLRVKRTRVFTALKRNQYTSICIFTTILAFWIHFHTVHWFPLCDFQDAVVWYFPHNY